MRVRDAATNPKLAGSDVERLRERLAAAGLLEVPLRRSSPRPAAEKVAAARAAAARGKQLSDLITQERS